MIYHLSDDIMMPDKAESELPVFCLRWWQESWTVRASKETMEWSNRGAPMTIVCLDVPGGTDTENTLYLLTI